jgi:hypothetical protein
MVEGCVQCSWPFGLVVSPHNLPLVVIPRLTRHSFYHVEHRYSTDICHKNQRRWRREQRSERTLCLLSREACRGTQRESKGACSAAGRSV